MKQGKNVNEVLDMPVHYITSLLKEKITVKKSSSFFDLLS